MRFQEANLSLSGYLAKRLLPSTLAIALIISFVFPATYYTIASRAAERTATIYAQEFSEKIYEFMITSPALWKYQAQKYMQTVYEFTRYKDVTDIHILDEKGRRITCYISDEGEHTEKQHFSNLNGTSHIVFNNSTVRTVAVYVSRTSIFRATFLIFLFSLALGSGLASYAYVFPVRVVKRAESAIRESEEKYRNNHEQARDIIFTISRDTHFISLNPAFDKITGWSKEEWLGRSFAHLLHPDDLPKAMVLLQSTLRGEAVDVFELRVLKRSGEYFVGEFTVSPVTQGGAVLALGHVRDASERHNMERELRERTAQIEAVNRELESFAYVVSHDLKAPLRAITSLSSWLATDYADKLDEQGRETLGLLVQRAKRMNSLIDGILQYSRVGRTREEMQLVDLDTVVKDVIDLVAPPERVAVTIETKLPTLLCEKNRIHQVFQNLISNAVKHLDKPEGIIRIGCVDSSELGDTPLSPPLSRGELKGDEEFHTFYVSDNGPGIEEQYFDKIFQMFQTLKPRDEVENTGVGLTIVKKIVEMYGGKIWVESKLGEGSTFRFTMPRTEIGVKITNNK
ncbi:MAG: PAS domain S-box protein [Nitrospirota bacterium]